MLQLDLPCCLPSTSSAEEHHVRTCPAPEQRPESKARARRSGSTCSPSSPTSGPDSSSGKTFVDRFGGAWSVLSMGLMPSVTPWSGPSSRRQTLERHTGDSASSSSDSRPMPPGGAWPTPTVKGNYNRKGLSQTSGDGLATAVNRLEDSPGPLNPTFLEWLMGFPIGWTESAPLETPSSCAIARLHSGSSATSGKGG